MLVVLTLVLSWSQALQQYSLGPYQTSLELFMRYLIGDVSAGENVHIEVTFPDGALNGVDPISYTPKIINVGTQISEFTPDGWKSTPIP